MLVSRNRCIFLNVGLGEDFVLFVGVFVLWFLVILFIGWLKCNGVVFFVEEYLELVKVYSINKLFDLCGEFICGWDDGCGIDVGCVLLSFQNGGVELYIYQGQFFRVSDYRIKEILVLEVMGRGYIVSLMLGVDSLFDFDDYFVFFNLNGYFVGNQRIIVYGVNEICLWNIVFNYIVRVV